MNKPLGPGKLALIGLALIAITPFLFSDNRVVSLALTTAGLLALFLAIVGGMKKMYNKNKDE